MTLVQLCSLSAFGYILPLEIILQKNATLVGTSIFGVEQDVQFNDGVKTYTVKEVWLIEGDRNLRLVARGTGPLKEAVNLTYVYNNKTRTSLSPAKTRQTKQTGNDFFEKYLAVKSKESTRAYLKDMGISSQVKYSRAAGKVCLAVGDTATDSSRPAQMLFDQDTFELVKIYLPSQAEVEFSDYNVIGSIHYPRKKQVQFSGTTVNIVVTRVGPNTSASIRNFYPDTVESASVLNTESLGSIGPVIEEFYSRFR